MSKKTAAVAPSPRPLSRAFLTSSLTIAVRVVRAKAKIRDGRLPYHVPSGPELSERIGAVLAVIYLLFG